MDFDKKPFAAASLATVHVARLKTTNEKVAIKIQHPKVKAHSFLDLATMEFFVRLGAKIFPDFKLMWLVEETKKNLPLGFKFEIYSYFFLKKKIFFNRRKTENA